MTVGVVPDFGKTFTTDFFYKIACQNNDCVSQVSIPQKRKGHGLLKKIGGRSMAVLFLFFFKAMITLVPLIQRK